jgi:hypothetical protein
MQILQLLGHKRQVVIIYFMDKTHKIYARTSPELVSNAILKFDKKHFDKRNDIYSKKQKEEMLEFLNKLKK